jgi:hypothetical protein
MLVAPMNATRALLSIGLFAFVFARCGGAAVGGDTGAHDTGVVEASHEAAVDVPPPPDVPVTGLPQGSPCTADSQCASGICAQGAGIQDGCTIACQHDNDCASIAGGADTCALDNSPGITRFVCTVVATASGFEGDACMSNGDCSSFSCVGGVCRSACVMDSECTAGSRCVAMTAPGGSIRECGSVGISGPVVENYTIVDGTVTTDTGGPHVIAVPDDVVSLMFIAQDLSESNIFASVPTVQAPDGTLWVDAAHWNGIMDQPVREIPWITQVNSVLAPSNDVLRVHGGQYQVTYALINDTMSGTHVRSAHLRATVRIKRAPGGVLPSSGNVHVHFYFAGVSVNAATAPTNARLQAAIHQMQTIYGTVGIGVNVSGYTDITGTDATTFMVIDSQAELDQCLTRSTSSTGDEISVFLVSSISASAGLEGAIGVAGDIVGPPGIHGTTHSGVVVGWDSTHGTGFDVLGQTMSHECGHYLGLWHTRENLPGCTTMLGATCSPFGGVDPITDTPTGAGASSYMMYWQTNGGNVTVSPGEGIVMRSNALVL